MKKQSKISKLIKKLKSLIPFVSKRKYNEIDSYYEQCLSKLYDLEIKHYALINVVKDIFVELDEYGFEPTTTTFLTGKEILDRQRERLEI
jgi:hypothetical protein